MKYILIAVLFLFSLYAHSQSKDSTWHNWYGANPYTGAFRENGVIEIIAHNNDMTLTHLADSGQIIIYGDTLKAIRNLMRLYAEEIEKFQKMTEITHQMARFMMQPKDNSQSEKDAWNEIIFRRNEIVEGKPIPRPK